MTFELPRPGDPIRPLGPRDAGDAWAVGPTGERFWGRFGAAGLLAVDPDRGVLLQHRVSWSHFGDTWGLPGGARHAREQAAAAALREAAEEAGVPPELIRPRLLSVLDLGFWSYTTLLGDVTRPFEPVIGDRESHALAWVPLEEVERHPLHPGFAKSWQRLGPLVATRPAVVVDAANVVGSVPDGWWRDRVGAAGRLLTSLEALAAGGIPGESLGLPEATWFPEWVVVLEGQARNAAEVPGLLVVRATGSGDDEILVQAQWLVSAGRAVTVVTSDQGLAQRVERAGAQVRGTGWLRDLLA